MTLVLADETPGTDKNPSIESIGAPRYRAGWAFWFRASWSHAGKETAEPNQVVSATAPLSEDSMKRSHIFALLIAVAAATPVSAFTTDLTRFDAVLRWSEEQRAFFQDGPGYLFSEETRLRLLDLPSDARAATIDELLADPFPETPENELVLAIEKRRQLVRKELLSFQDARARMIFVQGLPQKIEKVDCLETYHPLEIWTYDGFARPAVLYRPERDDPWRLWLPVDGKRPLFIEEMAYYLDQIEELGRRIIRPRKTVDKFFCELTDRVDEVTGIKGIYGVQKDRVRNEEILPFLDPPAELAAWTRDVLDEPEPAISQISEGELKVFYPERRGQRMVTRFRIDLPNTAELGVFTENEKTEVRFALVGLLEQANETFEEFRMRFQLSIPPEGAKGRLVLLADRALRPGQRFLARLKLIDEVTGKSLILSRALIVADTPSPEPVLEVPGDLLVAIGEDLGKKPIQGYDSIALIPPASDVVFGLWRAEALVTGGRIVKVKFSIDGTEQVSRKNPPYSAELRLSTFPTEQTVRVDGYDEFGVLVATDEVVVNQPRGELRIRILEPLRGAKAEGEVKVKLEVVVPEEKKVARVLLLINEELRATLENPPWEATLPFTGQAELDYLTAVAELEDGSRAEDVRFLNAPEQVENIEVDLVELYTTVVESNGHPAGNMRAEDFEILEDGRPQKIEKFELVENLPIQVGIVIDTSGSMIQSLGEAQKAATSFLEAIIGPGDRCFALSFSDKPLLLMQRTSDVGAVAEQLEKLSANGATSLHDAVVTSLYYFRGVRGRRALVLLSDGEDTASSLPFRDALEYSRRSGVAVFSIGLRIGKFDMGVRNKLDTLAKETGGRAIFIENAADLQTAYAEIEKELRSQYLIAYKSDQGNKQGFREIAVKVRGGKLEARTIRGYYP